jgi:hypothetical protein
LCIRIFKNVIEHVLKSKKPLYVGGKELLYVGVGVPLLASVKCPLSLASFGLEILVI